MSYTVKNKIKRPIVCTLKDGSTLRLPINGQTTIKDSQITEHVKSMSEKGILILSEITVSQPRVEKSEKKKSTESSKEKEEK